MNLHHLKVFRAVAEAGGISAGAARLHISQPAVTREIRDLEASLGLALFDRHPRGVTPTEGGQRLLQFAQALGQLLENIGGLFQGAALLFEGGDLGRDAGPIELFEQGEFFQPGQHRFGDDAHECQRDSAPRRPG